MNHSAVHQERDAAECLELILNKISEQASEVSTYEIHHVSQGIKPTYQNILL